MRRTICLLLAACSPVYAASAQDAYLTWTNDAPPSGALLGDTVTLTLELSFTPDPGQGFARSIFDIIGDSDIQNINHDESQNLGRYYQLSYTSDGATVGDDILGIDEWQLPRGFGGGTPLNPIPDFYVFEYTVTDPDVRAITYTSYHEGVFIYQDAFGTSIPYAMHITPTTFWINIPAPGGMVLLGLGGLVAVRRRRA